MRNYKAEQILDAASFPATWVSNLQQKHIDLLIERILFFMMDNKLSERQGNNFVSFMNSIDNNKAMMIALLLVSNQHIFTKNFYSDYVKQIISEKLPNSALSNMLNLLSNKKSDFLKESKKLNSKLIKYADSKIESPL